MNYVYLNDAVIFPVCNICVEMLVYDICSPLSFFLPSLYLPPTLSLSPFYFPWLGVPCTNLAVKIWRARFLKGTSVTEKKKKEKKSLGCNCSYLMQKLFWVFHSSFGGSLLKLHVGRLNYCFLNCVFIYMYKLSKSNTVFHFLIYPAMLVFLSATENHSFPVGSRPSLCPAVGCAALRGPSSPSAPAFPGSAGHPGGILQGRSDPARRLRAATGTQCCDSGSGAGHGRVPPCPLGHRGLHRFPYPGHIFVHCELESFPRPPVCKDGCLQRAVKTFRDLFCSFKWKQKQKLVALNGLQLLPSNPEYIVMCWKKPLFAWLTVFQHLSFFLFPSFFFFFFLKVLLCPGQIIQPWISKR